MLHNKKTLFLLLWKMADIKKLGLQLFSTLIGNDFELFFQKSKTIKHLPQLLHTWGILLLVLLK